MAPPPPGGPSPGGPPPGGPPPGGGSPPYPGPAGWGGFGPGGQPRAPKPGIIPLRPLGLGEILDGALGYIRTHPRVVLGTSAIVAVISQLVQVPLQLLTTLGLPAATAGSGSGNDLGPAIALVVGAFSVGLLGQAITLIATTVLTGILMVVISRSVLGQPVDGAGSWRAARTRVPGLLGLVLLVGIANVLIIVVGAVPGVLLTVFVNRVIGILVIVLGVLAAIAAVVWVSVSLSLAAPAYVLEGVRVTDALRRSWFLVKGRFWPVLGIQLLAGIVAGTVALIITAPFSLAGSVAGVTTASQTGATAAPSVLAVVLGGIGTIIALTLTTPFQSGVTGLLYVDQRMRREAFDLELQRAGTR